MPSTETLGPAPVASELSGRIVYSQAAPEAVDGGFANRFDVYISNADGTNVVRLTPATLGAFNEGASLSPDGARVVFSSRDGAGGSSAIYLVNPDGSGLRRLTDDEGRANSPVWSPDGRSIIYNVPGADGISQGQLMEIDADGAGEPRRRASTFLPTYSADGKFEAYSTRESPQEIYVIATGGRRGVLVSPPDNQTGAYALSPDGSQLAYVDYGARPNQDSSLFIVNREGTERRLVATVAGEKGDVSFSPDGKYLAYSAGSGREAFNSPRAVINIYITRADGKSASRLFMSTENRGSQFSPSWGR